MNSFTLTAVGHLARNPELVAKGNTAYARFCLVGTDYAGKDEEGAAREVITTIWFVAFGALGEAVARHSRKGDQLFVEARVRANLWTNKQGEKQYDHSFVVQGFRFGAPGRAKRDERDARREDGHGLQRYEERADGLGLRRSEERTDGRDRGANGGVYAGVGTHAVFGMEPRSGAEARVGPRNGVVLPAGAAAGVNSRDGATYGRVGGANESSRAREPVGAKVAVSGIEGSGTDGSAGVSGAADGEASGGDDESANAHDSANTGEFSSANESHADKPGDGDKPSGVDRPASAHECARFDESGGAHESSDVEESDGAKSDEAKSDEADESDGVEESSGADESGQVDEPNGSDESAGADRSVGGSGSARTGGKAGSDEATAVDEPISADESASADGSSTADESADEDGATGEDRAVEDRTDSSESRRAGKGSHAGRGANARTSTASRGAVKVAMREPSKESAKSGETGAKPRANAARTREKTGSARTGRRAPASAS
jgi:single-strand DNA-binding protein